MVKLYIKLKHLLYKGIHLCQNDLHSWFQSTALGKGIISTIFFSFFPEKFPNIQGIVSHIIIIKHQLICCFTRIALVWDVWNHAAPTVVLFVGMSFTNYLLNFTAKSHLICLGQHTINPLVIFWKHTFAYFDIGFWQGDWEVSIT